MSSIVTNQVKITGINIGKLIEFSKTCKEQSISQWSGIKHSFEEEDIEFFSDKIIINVTSRGETIDNHLIKISRIFNVTINYIYYWESDMEFNRLYIKNGRVIQEIKLSIDGLNVVTCEE